MSKLAYERFMASYMLTPEEQLPENRNEIIAYTEDVLQEKGIECDNTIAKLPQEQIKEILEEVRKLRKNKKKKKTKPDEQEEAKEEEAEIVASN